MNNTLLVAGVISTLLLGLGVLGFAGWSSHNSNSTYLPMSKAMPQGQSYYNKGPMGPGMMGGQGYSPMGPGMMGSMGSMMHQGMGMGHMGMMGGWGHCPYEHGQHPSQYPFVPQGPQPPPAQIQNQK